METAYATGTFAPPVVGGGLKSIIGNDPAFRRAIGLLLAAASVEEPVLVLGETGTGKELFAGALHAHSSRAVSSARVSHQNRK